MHSGGGVIGGGGPEFLLNQGIQDFLLSLSFCF